MQADFKSTVSVCGKKQNKVITDQSQNVTYDWLSVLAGNTHLCGSATHSLPL